MSTEAMFSFETVGELRTFLEGLPANTPILTNSLVFNDRVSPGGGAQILLADNNYTGLPLSRIIDDRVGKMIQDRNVLYLI